MSAARSQSRGTRHTLKKPSESVELTEILNAAFMEDGSKWKNKAKEIERVELAFLFKLDEVNGEKQIKNWFVAKIASVKHQAILASLPIVPQVQPAGSNSSMPPVQAVCSNSTVPSVQPSAFNPRVPPVQTGSSQPLLPVYQQSSPQSCQQPPAPAEHPPEHPPVHPAGSNSSVPPVQAAGSNSSPPSVQPAASNPRVPPLQPAGSYSSLPSVQPAASNPRVPPVEPAGSNSILPSAQPAASNPRVPPVQPASSNSNVPSMQPAASDPRVPPMQSSRRRRPKGFVGVWEGGGLKKPIAKGANAPAKRILKLAKERAKLILAAKRAARINYKKKTISDRLSQNDGIQCSTPGCTRIFPSEKKLQNHLRLNDCSNGCNPFRRAKRPATLLCSTDDKRKKAIQDASSKSQVKWVRAADTKSSVEVLGIGGTSGTYKMPNGAEHKVPTLPRGYCCKSSKRTQRVYTKQQVKFIEWCYLQGVKGTHGGKAAYKYTADRAAYDMKMYGTQLGVNMHPTSDFWAIATSAEKTKFDQRELLDHYSFKTWFNKKPDVFKRAIANALGRAVASITDLVTHNAGIEEMDEDE